VNNPINCSVHFILFGISHTFVLLEFLLRPLFPQYLNWADFATFSLYFLLGFILQINQKIILFIEKNAYKFLLIAISCWSVYLINKTALDSISIPEYTLNYFLSLHFKKPKQHQLGTCIYRAWKEISGL
jgi:hypothetical protein